MQSRNRYRLGIILTLSMSFFLNIFAINWGLPWEWHLDEGLNIHLAKELFPFRLLITASVPYAHFGYYVYPYFLWLLLKSYSFFGTLFPQGIFNFEVTCLICRLSSVLIGTLTVFLVYLFCSKIFDSKSGFFSALYLALTMGLVNLYHFAIPEAIIVFLATLSLLFCTLLIKTGKTKYYLMTGLCIGFNIGIKYTIVFLLPAIFLGFFLSIKRDTFELKKEKPLDNSYIFAIILMAGLILTIFGFLTTTTDTPVNLVKDYFSPDQKIEPLTASFLKFLGKVLFGLGIFTIIWAMLIKCFKSIRAISKCILTNKKIVLGLVSILFGFLLASPHIYLDSPLFSNGLIYTWNLSRGLRGHIHLFHNLLRNFSILNNTLGTPLLILCLLGIGHGLYRSYKLKDKYVAFLTFCVISFYILSGFSHRWPMRYMVPVIPPFVILAGLLTSRFLYLKGLFKILSYTFIGIVIAYSSVYVGTLELIFINDSRYKARDWIVENIPRDSTIDVYSKWKEYLPPLPAGFRVRTISEIADMSIKGKEFDKFIKRYRENSGDYLILTSLYYSRYFDENEYPERTKFYHELIDEKFGYKLVKRFKFQTLLKPKPEFVNPVILVFKREK